MKTLLTMKNIRKISWSLLFLLLFAACKNKKDAASEVQPFNDSSVYNNTPAADSIRTVQQNKPTGSYSYYPKESEANKNQTEKSVSKNKVIQEQHEQNASGEPQEDHKRGWSKNAQGAVTGEATDVKDKKNE